MPKNQFKFRSNVSKDKIDKRARERGFLTRAEYFRALLREDLQRAEGTADEAEA